MSSFKGIFCCIKDGTEVPEVLELDYRHSSLCQVPGEIFNWERTLEKLYLSSNQLTDLHPQLFHCSELKELECKDNDLKVLPPGIGNLTKLQRLDASRNVIEEISENIKLCKDLKYLDLSLNLLSKVPDGIYGLVGLEEINLSDTYLEYLNANFCRLSKLKVLELRENHLQSLPKSMTRFHHLHRLDLGQNDITEMPDVIGSMTNLQELLLDGNSLRRVPSLVGNLHKLNSLDITGNEVLELSDSIGKCAHLNDLSLNSNQIQALPDSFAKLEQLTVLRLDGNQIQYLPENFGHLKNLQEFTMVKNYLRELPPSIGLLRKLVLLLLDENLLQGLPKEIGSCTSLSVLAVARNRIQSIPSEIGHLSNLKVLNLAGNCLQHLPVSILNIPKLGAIWLTEAQSKPLVPLNKEVDPESGQIVITCYLLPQVIRPPYTPTDLTYDEESPGPNNTTRTSVIRFADLNYSEEDDAEEEKLKAAGEEACRIPLNPNTESASAANGNGHLMSSGESGDYPRSTKTSGLLRAPTPYPKELRALAKHAAQILSTKHHQHQHELQHSDSNGDLQPPPSPPTQKSEPNPPLISQPQDESLSGKSIKSPPPYHIAAMSSRRAAFFAGTFGPITSQDLSAATQQQQHQQPSPRQPEYIKAMENRLGESGSGILPTPPPTPTINNNNNFNRFQSEVAKTNSNSSNSNCNSNNSFPAAAPPNPQNNIDFQIPDLPPPSTTTILEPEPTKHVNPPAASTTSEFLKPNFELKQENETPNSHTSRSLTPTRAAPSPTNTKSKIPVRLPTDREQMSSSSIHRSSGFSHEPNVNVNVQGTKDKLSSLDTSLPATSNGRIPNKNPNRNQYSKSESRIPTATVLGASPTHGIGNSRKPWIFGSHRNARVVSLEHKRPPGNNYQSLGFSVEGLEEGGVFVGEVDKYYNNLSENTTENERGLKVGDKILQVDGIDVSSINKAIVQIILSNCKKTIHMLVSRES